MSKFSGPKPLAFLFDAPGTDPGRWSTRCYLGRVRDRSTTVQDDDDFEQALEDGKISALLPFPPSTDQKSDEDSWGYVRQTSLRGGYLSGDLAAPFDP